MMFYILRIWYGLTTQRDVKDAAILTCSQGAEEVGRAAKTLGAQEADTAKV